MVAGTARHPSGGRRGAGQAGVVAESAPRGAERRRQGPREGGAALGGAARRHPAQEKGEELGGVKIEVKGLRGEGDGG